MVSRRRAIWSAGEFRSTVQGCGGFGVASEEVAAVVEDEGKLAGGAEQDGRVEIATGGVCVACGCDSIECGDGEGVLQDGANEEDAPALLDVEGHVDGGKEGEGVDAADVWLCAAELG